MEEVESPADNPTNSGSKPPAENEALLKIKLPPLPNAVRRVAELCDCNSPTYVVADAVGYDPALAAQMLRAANSPLYSKKRRITALTTACDVLGLRLVHKLTISYAASSLFDRPDSPSGVEHTMWRHAVFVALASRTITSSFSTHGSEETFLSGLLHDVGKNLMLQLDKKRYTPLLKISDEDQLLEAEREAFGFTHPQVSARLVNHWGLASDISDAVLNHHSPDDALHSLLGTRVLRAADKLAKASGYGVTNISKADLEADESVYLLGLSEERLAEIREEVDESMTEMMQILEK
jgi:HD-like signal output (HDOD) protein